MIRRPPRSTLHVSSAASDVYKRQHTHTHTHAHTHTHKTKQTRTEIAYLLWGKRNDRPFQFQPTSKQTDRQTQTDKQTETASITNTQVSTFVSKFGNSGRLVFVLDGKAEDLGLQLVDACHQVVHQHTSLVQPPLHVDAVCVCERHRSNDRLRGERCIYY